MSEVIEKMTSHVGANLEAYVAEYQEKSKVLAELEKKISDAKKDIDEALTTGSPIKDRIIALGAAIQCFQSMKNIVAPVVPAVEAAVEVVEAVAEVI